MTKKEAEKILESELEHNEVLAKVLKDKKSKELYIEKMLDSENALGGNPVLQFRQCSTCVFSKSDVIAENGAHKGWCRMYSKEIGVPKPFAILHDEEKCQYRLEK